MTTCSGYSVVILVRIKQIYQFVCRLTYIHSSLLQNTNLFICKLVNKLAVIDDKCMNDITVSIMLVIVEVGKKYSCSFQEY